MEGARAPDCSFKELVLQLAEVHERILSEQEIELKSLRRQLAEWQGNGAHSSVRKETEDSSCDEAKHARLAPHPEGELGGEGPATRALEVRAVWEARPVQSHMLAKQHSKTELGDAGRRSSQDSSLSPRPEEEATGCAVLILPPTAGVRLAWDVFGALLIFYDAVVLPFDSAFRPKEGVVLIFMDWLATVFWTLDIGWSFLTGYHSKGAVVMNPWYIALHYTTSWFIVDVAVVGLDWLSKTQASISETEAGFGRIFRSLRTMRMLRLLRLLKLKRILGVISERIDSEYLYTLASLGKLLGLLLLVNHLIACGWFSISLATRDAGQPNWINQNQMIEKSIWWQYTTSLHWALTQFTPASMEVFPQNETERSLAVVVLILSLVSFSSFLASISSSMAVLYTMDQETNKQFWLLRRFLKQQQVARPVAGRVLKYLEYSCAQRQETVQVASVKILDLLSPGLRDELQYEMTYVKLVHHPLFEVLVAEQEAFMVKLCTVATTTATFADTDVLFHQGVPASCMYFLVRGSLEYLQFGAFLQPPLMSGESLAEASLWLPWVHSGRSHATVETEVLIIDSSKFCRLAAKYVDTWNMCSYFARCFRDEFIAGGSDVFRSPDFYENVRDSMKALQALGDRRTRRKSWMMLATGKRLSIFSTAPVSSLATSTLWKAPRSSMTFAKDDMQKEDHERAAAPLSL
ncbi:unnamed protein product [Effrenium voratum]|uniref:Cyclic nucleotide-binding domain-containing protein n=1 Tax=Effrenium voratum TaxID=2562239 RepID=A0AA36NCS2_9DINO|nr:unnamed protein product [Effrenium voratum]